MISAGYCEVVELIMRESFLTIPEKLAETVTLGLALLLPIDGATDAQSGILVTLQGMFLLIKLNEAYPPSTSNSRYESVE